MREIFYNIEVVISDKIEVVKMNQGGRGKRKKGEELPGEIQKFVLKLQ